MTDNDSSPAEFFPWPQGLPRTAGLRVMHDCLYGTLYIAAATLAAAWGPARLVSLQSAGWLMMVVFYGAFDLSWDVKGFKSRVVQMATWLVVGVYLLWLGHLHWPSKPIFVPAVSFGSVLSCFELFIWAATVTSLSRFAAISAMTLVARRRQQTAPRGWMDRARGASHTLISVKQSAADLRNIDDRTPRH